MTKLRLALTLGVSLAAVAALLLTATSALSTPQAPSQSFKGVTLTVWDAFPPTPAKKAVDAAFTKATGVKLNYTIFPTPFETNLLAKWTAGGRPDILWFDTSGNWQVQLNPTRTLEDLSKEPWNKKYVKPLRSAALWKGKHYVVFLDAPQTAGVLYNKKVISESGLQVPTTLSQLLQFCKELPTKVPGVAPVFYGGADQWMLQNPPGLFLNDFETSHPNFVNQVNENKAHFTDPGFVAAIQATQQMINAGCFNKDVLTAHYTDEQKAIMDGSAALDVQGDYEVPTLAAAYGGTKAVDNTLGFSPLGLTSPGVDVLWPQVLQAFYLPKTGNSTREAAALAYAKFITGKGYRLYLAKKGGFPAFTGYSPASGTTHIQQVAHQLQASVGVPAWSLGLEAPYGQFEVMMSELFAGTKTASQVAAELQQNFDTSAKQLKLPGF